MIDSVATFIVLLKSKSAITDLVGDRIYPNDIPENDFAFPQITVSGAVDIPHNEVPLLTSVFYVKCWSDTNALAAAIYTTVFNEIHYPTNYKVAGVHIYTVELEQGQPVKDEETGKYFYVATYRVKFRNPRD